MSNYVQNYKYNLGKKYLKKLNKRKHEKIIVAIEIIETSNRTFIWRIIEYLVVINELLLFKRKKSLTNYSIGIYQLKMTMILNYMCLEYDLREKVIFIKTPLKFKDKIEMLSRRNSSEMLKYSILNRFPDYNLNDLSDQELEEIALFYSRNIIFNGELNYYTILKYLYSLEKTIS